MSKLMQINISLTACSAEELVKELQDMIRSVRKDSKYVENMAIAEFNGTPITISIANCACQPRQDNKVTTINPSIN